MSHEASFARAAIDAHVRSVDKKFPEERASSFPLANRTIALLTDLMALTDEEGCDWSVISIEAQKNFDALRGAGMSGAALGIVRLPLEIQRAAGVIIDAARTQKSYKAAVASQYAEALLRDPRATASAEAVRVQLMYLKGNLGWWKGPEAVEAKKAMERIIKRQVPLE